jgi:hypothetical protein
VDYFPVFLPNLKHNAIPPQYYNPSINLARALKSNPRFFSSPSHPYPAIPLISFISQPVFTQKASPRSLGSSPSLGFIHQQASGSTSPPASNQQAGGYWTIPFHFFSQPGFDQKKASSGKAAAAARSKQRSQVSGSVFL